MFVKHHRVQDSLGALQEAEVALARRLSLAGGPHAFRLTGTWLIRENLLVDETLARLTSGDRPSAMPGLDRFSIGRLLAARLFGPRTVIATSAYAVALKSNIRAFYAVPEFLTLKIPAPGLGAETLAHELPIRGALEGIRSIRVPRVVESSIDSNPPFILEESVPGARPGRRAAAEFIRSVGVPKILDFYEERDPQLATVESVLDFQTVKRNVEAARTALGSELSAGAYGEVVKGVERAEALKGGSVVMVYGHGDLSRNNVIVSGPDELCLIDWERAARMMLFDDMAKMLRDFPAIRPVIDARVTRWFGNRGDDLLTGTQQLSIAYLCRLGRAVDGWRRYRSLGHDAAAFRARFYLRSARRQLAGFRNAVR